MPPLKKIRVDKTADLVKELVTSNLLYRVDITSVLAKFPLFNEVRNHSSFLNVEGGIHDGA